MAALIDLNADTPEDLGRLGGKGCGLVRLLRAGLRVPDAWVLPADLEEIPEREIRELADKLAADADGLLAVRSSATAEDLADASFAGVYDTILGVRGGDEVVEAVKRVRSALQTDAARAYRDEKGIGQNVGIAVILQRMIEPDAAGVVLTTNPQRSFASEVVVDCAYGLGEGVVSGRTDPDHVVLDRADASVREERIGEKRIALRYVKGEGVVEEQVADDLRARRALDDDQLVELCELARNVDARIAVNSDCEWAYRDGVLYLLQQRPITSLPDPDAENVWTRRYGDEYIAGYVSPYTYGGALHTQGELLWKEMWRIGGRTDLDAKEVFRRHNGHIYLSGNFMIDYLRAVPQQMRGALVNNWFTPMFLDRINAGPFDPARTAQMMVAPMRDRDRTGIANNVKALERNNARVEAEVRPKLFQDYAQLSDDAWRNQYERVAELSDEHFRIIRWGMGLYNNILHSMLERLLEAWAGDDGTLYTDVISGLAGTKTAEINQQIWELGRLARSSDELVAALHASTDYADVRESVDAPDFWREFDRFLRRHGHRGSSREVADPRWRETPEIILGFVRTQVIGATDRSPAEIEAGAAERREVAEAEVLDKVGASGVKFPGLDYVRNLVLAATPATVPDLGGSGVVGAPGIDTIKELVGSTIRAARDLTESGVVGVTRREMVRSLMSWTQRYTVYRENQRYHLDYMISQSRYLVLEQGRRLAEAGVIAEAGDAFLLAPEELVELVETPVRTDARLESLAALREERLVWMNRKPATFLFDDVETEGELVEGDPDSDREADATSGLGAARGSADGPVRVLSDQAELDSVEPGDILVAPNIDPGWTNVFPLLAGLITETGGLLSHGALLAREYGIPAVMGVPDALVKFESGQRVSIDGTAGTIEIQDG